MKIIMWWRNLNVLSNELFEVTESGYTIQEGKNVYLVVQFFSSVYCSYPGK